LLRIFCNDVLILIVIITTGTVIVAMTTIKYVIAELYVVCFSITIVPLLLDTFQVFFSYQMMDISCVYQYVAMIYLALFVIRKIAIRDLKHMYPEYTRIY